MKKYQYYVECFLHKDRFLNRKELGEHLDELGGGGWELISVFPTDGAYELIWKRVKKKSRK